VQILVVVAIIQLKSLKAEVEKGSAAMLISCRLVDPKQQIKLGESFGRNAKPLRKGKKLIFFYPGLKFQIAVTQRCW